MGLTACRRYGNQLRLGGGWGRSMSDSDRRQAGRRKAKPRTGPRRAIDEAAVQRVCQIIRTWPATIPLTWEALVKMTAQVEKGGWTRQGLNRHKAIVDAFQQRKIDLRKSPKPSKDPLVVVLRRQIEDREAENQFLREKLAHYEERFIVMIRNATARGLTRNDLEAPLPPIDRARI